MSLSSDASELQNDNDASDNDQMSRLSDEHRWTPLIMASKGGFTDMVALLLEKNSNVNAIDQDGRSALSWSAKEGYSDIVSKLLETGAQINMPDKNGDTPLILAAKEGHVTTIKILLAANAKIEVTDNEKKTALSHAVEQGHLNAVTELINSGANFNHRDGEGETPLIRAAKKKHTQCARVLLTKGADSNATDKKGDTPLHIAVRNRHYSMCEILVKDTPNNEALNLNITTGEIAIDISNQTNITKSGASIECDDITKMDQNNVFLATLADFFVEPSLTVPLSVGLFSKWENGKSQHAQKLMNLMEQHRQHEMTPAFLFTMSVVLFIMVTATTIGMFIWITFTWIDAIATAIVIVVLALALLALARMALLSSNNRINRCGILLTNFFNRSMWFLKIVYCLPASISTVRSMLPVHIITIDLSQKLLSSNSPISALVNMTSELTDAIEEDLGIYIPRLYRIFQAAPIRLHPPNADVALRWKTSCCCIPSFVITLGVLLCLWLSIILFGISGVRGTSAIVAIQIACCCVLICAVLVYILRFLLMIYCLVLSTKKRIRIMSNQPNIQEETFVSVLKQEIDLCTDMIACVDGFARHQTRIIINVDFLESLEQDKALHLINLFNILLCDPNHPFILIMSIDPRLLVKAADQSYEGGSENIPYDFLKNLFNLPYFIVEPLKIKIDGILPSEYQRQLGMISSDNQEDLEWDLNDGFQISNDLLNVDRSLSSREDRTISEREDTRLLSSRSLKLSFKETSPSKSDYNEVCAVSTENLDNIADDLSYLFKNNEFRTLTDVKRVMNIVSLNGRILRNTQIPFQWTRLAIWVALCDEWPCKSTWITILCLDGELNLPERMKVRQVNEIFGYGIPTIPLTFLGSDSDSSYFDTFISSHKPSITVEDVRIFAPFMIYIDPMIRRVMLEYFLAIKSHSPKVCSGTSSACKSIANNEHLLVLMTVKDVASQLVEIDGMDEFLLPIYKTRILDNNINGRVLATCDLNELRDVMQMKFGDWQLFKAWILFNLPKNQNLNLSRFPGHYRALSDDNSFLDEAQLSFKLDQSPETFTKRHIFASNFEPIRNKDMIPSYLKSSPTSRFRKQFKHNIANEEIISQDDTPTVFRVVENGWHLSADSGFASTDIDHNVKLALRQNSLPERQNIKVIENGQHSVDYPDVPTIHLEYASRPLSPETYESSLTRDSCHSKNGIIDLLGTDRVSYGGENNFVSSSSVNGQNVHKNTISANKSGVRPISLSEVPLPPAYMLDQSDIWPVDPPSEFTDDIDTSHSSSPSFGSDRKMALKYAAKYHSMSTHFSSSSTDTGHGVPLNNAENNKENTC